MPVPERPTVLVDMDGPLADFDREFFAYCGRMGWPMDCTLETQTARYATDHIIDPGHRRKARRNVDTSPWFAMLPVTDGAVEGLNRLAESTEVWICTKPLEANKTCRDDKAAWLVEHFGKEWERRLIITPDKSMVCGDVLLDDAPKPEWYGRASWRPVIFPAGFNGPGSEWADLPRWSWSDPIDDLLAEVRAGA